MGKKFVNEKQLIDSLRLLFQFADEHAFDFSDIEKEVKDLLKETTNIKDTVNNITLESINGIKDAPYDENYYVRYNGKWVKLSDLPINAFPDNLGCNCDHTTNPPEEKPEEPDNPDPPEEKENIGYYSYYLNEGGSENLTQIFCVNKCKVSIDEKGMPQVESVIERCKLSDRCYVTGPADNGFSDYNVNGYLDEKENTYTVSFNITGDISTSDPGAYLSTNVELFYYEDDGEIHQTSVGTTAPIK